MKRGQIGGLKKITGVKEDDRGKSDGSYRAEVKGVIQEKRGMGINWREREQQDEMERGTW